jgi:hypothetical protein
MANGALAPFLETSGLLPVHAERIVDELRAVHGEAAPIAFSEELELARQLLTNLWRSPRPDNGGPHVSCRPARLRENHGVVQMARAGRAGGRSPAAVWRLDGHVANTAESLSVFSEILGVPWSVVPLPTMKLPDADVWFVDLPGVNPNDAHASPNSSNASRALPGAQVHLVLNAAYETPLLLAQLRAFAALPIQDVIVTHLDEESRWGKLWNLTLGTNCTLRFLGRRAKYSGRIHSGHAGRDF